MYNCVFDLLVGDKWHMSCPGIYGESDPESLQIGVVLWTGILLWRDERSGKPCVCNRAVEREKSSSSANAPEYDCPGDRMDPLAREIKLATPAIISDTRQIVTSTAAPTINFLYLEFRTATAGFMIVLSNCAPRIGRFNRNACIALVRLTLGVRI